MKFSIFSTGLLAGLTAMPSAAHAFNFGFVRVPDWMDPFFLPWIILIAVFWVATALVKPSGVPVNQLNRVKKDWITGFFYWSLQILAFGLAAFFFIGMGLRRAAEAGGSF